MFAKETTNRACTDFKYALVESMVYAEETQESVGLKLGVTQGQMNNWTNSNSDRNFPMALFIHLPSRMQQYLLNHLRKLSGQNQKFEGLNGSVDDEIVKMVMLEGDLKRQSESSPEKARQTIGKLREMLDRAEAELTAAK